MSKKSVYAVTLNWNQPQFTCDCVTSLLIQKDVEVHPIIVDNGSSDNSVALFRQKFPDIIIIELGENVGFAKGINHGICYALQQGAEYVLIINNDAVLANDSLVKLVETIDGKIQVVSPVVYYFDNPKQIWSTGGEINSFLLEPLNSHNQKIPIEMESIIPRTFLSGCVLLFGRDLLLEVGLFDERFFLYYEDLDLSLRISRSPYQMVVVTSAQAYHHVSVSSGGRDNPFERYHMARSSGIYFRKHVRGFQWLPILLYRGCSAIKWTLRLLITGKTNSLKAFWHGMIDGWITNFV